MKKQTQLLLLFLLVFGRAVATNDIIRFNAEGQPINMRPFFRIIEDEARQYKPEYLIANPEQFKEINNFQPVKPSNVFWLHTRIHSEDGADGILSFKHLTYAELYIMPDSPGAVLAHHVAGAFRPASAIKNGDSRFHFRLNLAAGVTYRILIRSEHTKQYQPVFDFELDELYRFTKARQKLELVDFWFQGAALVLLLYVLVTWATTRYRPYLWLAVFITGIIFYNLALNRYLIDWIFPEHPAFTWRFTVHFLHIGLAGFYLLILDFLKVKEKNYSIYRFGKFILGGILLLTIISFFINYFTANFKVMSQVNGAFLVVQVVYLVRILLLWKKLDRQERLLGYGIFIYLMVGLFITLALFIQGETIFNLFALLSECMLVIVSLLFLTGINGKLWQTEKNKSIYLSQLNQLQQKQNELLEQNVAERTRELNKRNERIELLINELNHRVKNNLQLLYSLNSLQLAQNRDALSNNILRDNVARIKAMMLVNDQLNPGNNTDDKSIAPVTFIAEIVQHTRNMFTQADPVEIKLNIDEKLVLAASDGLCLGLIVSELITNSYKHAFKVQEKPQINIDILRSDSNWGMHYTDNGIGIDNGSGENFGLTLIEDLTRQLKGHYTYRQLNGTQFFFNFPIQA